MSKDDDICWFHPNITREDAEALLMEDNRPEGSFLVRKSSSSFGDYVLSVLHDKQISHFQIRRHADDAFFSIDENIKMHGLESLIEYYMENPGVLAEGLVLKEPVKGEQPPPDTRRHGHTNLLHRATREGSYTVVKELLKTGYRHDTKNDEGQTAVHLASFNGKDDILRKLIGHGASINTRDTAGYTPLHYACQNNYPSTVRLLVQLGCANIQARNTTTGDVPLHDAASHGHKEVVKELLSLNAPANPRNNENLVPAQLARANNFIECAEILESYKCPSPKTHKSQWYHGTLDRHEAETKIRKYSSENGTFLVRWSERNNATVLTLLNENVFFNYIIQQQNRYLFIDNGPYLESLEHIVEYYGFISDGLPTTLRNPVPPEPKPPVPEFSTMPKPKKKTTYRTQATKTLSSHFHNIKFVSNFVSNNNNYKKEDVIGVYDDYIPSKCLTMGTQIGLGEFGAVFSGTYVKPDGEVVDVAIKTLHNEHLDRGKDNFIREAHLMMKLKHHCIVKLIGLSAGPPLMMVQELVAMGSMLTYLVENKTSISPDCEFKIWAAQIACGMSYLEKHRFVHRDLAARNILLSSRNQAKISDFGLSRPLNNDHEYYKAMQGGKWPIKWYAPESYNYGTFSHKSDVWSFGVTIWEMYSFGEIPYGERKGADVIKAIDSGERLPQPAACADRIYDIMKQCWEIDADKRPTFAELLNIFAKDSGYVNLKELIVVSDLP